MSGLTYFLALDSKRLQEFTREIRGNFTSQDEITMESVASLKYLNACMRLPCDVRSGFDVPC